MDRVFSVDIPDYLWSPAPVTQPAAAEEESSKMMNRSASAWALEQYLREATALDSSPLPPSSLKPVNADNEVVEIKNNCNPSTAAFAAGPPNVPMDSKEYQAFLRSQLDLACAAVAWTREDSAAVRHDNGSQTLQLIRSGHDLPKGEDKDAGGLIPSMQAMQKKSTTSGRSSRDLSDDDEVEEEAKRDRRMLSNRESARRSRKRKQAYLTGLETQVSQLRAENSSLVNRLTDICQKYNKAAADNSVLTAEVETLRAKVKMAQETVKRVTGSNVPSYVRDIHNLYEIISFDDGSPSDTPAGAAVPAQDDPKQHFYQPAPNPATPPVDGNKIGRTPSMQQRIRGDISS